ncbi:MAG TPA: DUF262 domain-containing protein [Planctomycetaceae bacterium]|nr:DUF262 domain-containing protein [Planctomycetaceae bacterium]
MRADPCDIKTVFGFERQLFAPLFQRPYVWTEKDQWEPFWQDVRRVAEQLLAGNYDCKPHFLGAVVLDQMRVPIGKPDARSIIDGQQRLTTLQLLMEGLRDLCRDREDLDLQKRRIEKLVENQDVSDPEDKFKLLPTNVDRPVFRAIIDTPTPGDLRKQIKKLYPDKRSRLAEAYEYFYKVIGDWLDLDGSDGKGSARCEALVNTIRDKLRIVVIDMDDQDDAQMIFETLNARGTPLLPSDLVKNFLFRTAQDEGEDVEQLHAKYWEPFDIEDHFWRGEIGVGRLKRARIDVFLHHYLSLQKREEVPIGELFHAYQDFAKQNEDKGIEWQLETFQRYSKHFKQFFEISSDSRTGLFFERLRRMQLTTIYPFLLGLYDATDGDDQRLPVLEDLESYLVRRMVCRLTTQGYNRLFLDLVAKLSEEAIYSQAGVRQFFQGQTADSAKWPNDEEFLNAWLNEPLYTRITRPRLRLVLYALDQELHNKKTESYTLPRGLTVEHLLPQHWERHWKLPPKKNEDPTDYVERERERNQLLHSIGNLTLLTSSLNPSISNGPLKEKKAEILKHSAINLNRFLSEQEVWNEAEIKKRGKKLFKLAKEIWSYPLST